jgi:transcriptional regulator with XRE-family HTH domain
MVTGRKYLTAYREAHGLSRKEFADVLGIAEVTLRSLENGNRRITPEKAKEFDERTGGKLLRVRLLPDFFAPPSGPREVHA